jgi:hypothetical protein
MRNPCIPALFVFAAACTAGEVNTTGNTGFTFQDEPTFSSGEFGPLAGYQDIGGEGYMARQFDGSTELNIAVYGVQPDVAYTAHLHVAACAANAGGHYKIDPSITTTSEANELWLHGHSSGAGTLFASASFPHRTRDDAKSLVVHDPATGAKMACADLIEY